MRAVLLLVLCLPALGLSGLAVAQAPTKSDAAALKQKGYVLYEGRWRLPQEIVYLQAAASRRAAASLPASLPATLPAAPAPAKALANESPRVAARSGSQPRRRSQGMGLLTVRLQQSRLLALDTVTVGFGTGQGRLQLPRTESISIGTTVGVPLR